MDQHLALPCSIVCFLLVFLFVFCFVSLFVNLSCSNIVGFFAKALLANSVCQNTKHGFILKSLWQYFWGKHTDGDWGVGCQITLMLLIKMGFTNMECFKCFSLYVSLSLLDALLQKHLFCSSTGAQPKPSLCLWVLAILNSNSITVPRCKTFPVQTVDLGEAAIDPYNFL